MLANFQHVSGVPVGEVLKFEESWMLRKANGGITWRVSKFKWVFSLINQDSEPVFYLTSSCEWWRATPGWSRSSIPVCGCRRFSLGWWGPHGAEPAVSLPAGYIPAAILTCHSSPCLQLWSTDSCSGAAHNRLRDPLLPSLPSSQAAVK